MKLNSQCRSFSAGVLIAIIALLCVAAVTPLAQNPFERETPIEFRVVVGHFRHDPQDLEKRMNTVAAEGWRFVEVESLGDGVAFAVFQRPRR